MFISLFIQLLDFHCASQFLLTVLGYYLLLTYLSHLFIYFSYRAPARLCTGQPGVIYGPGKCLIVNDKPILQLDCSQQLLLFTHIRTIQSGITSRTGLPQGTWHFLACLCIDQPGVMYVHSKSLNVNDKPVLQLDCSRLSGVRWAGVVGTLHKRCHVPVLKMSMPCVFTRVRNFLGCS